MEGPMNSAWTVTLSPETCAIEEEKKKKNAENANAK